MEQNGQEIQLASCMQGLNMKQQKFVHAYVSGQYTIKQLSKLLDVHEQTIYRWSKREDVIEALKYYQETEHQVIDNGIKNNAFKALKVMSDLLDSPIEQVRYQASKDLMDRAGYKAKQEVKVDKTVTNYEAQLKSFINGGAVDVDYEVSE